MSVRPSKRSPPNQLQQVSPFRKEQPIVDKDGRPTVEALRNLNLHFPNTTLAFSAATSAQSTADAAAPQSRLINTTSPILGGGDLTADLTFSHATSGVSAGTYGDATHVAQFTVDAKGHVTGVTAVAISAGGTGTVTTTGSPASGNLAKFSGATSIVNGDLSGDVTTSGTLATTIANDAVTTVKINNAAVTLAKIANASANSKLLGSGASGSGAAYSEITLGTGLTMTGTTLSASGGGGGGSSNAYCFPGRNFTTNDSGAFATLSNAFIPGATFTFDQIIAGFNAANIGDIYSAFVATINSSGVISGTVATASSRFTTTATGDQEHVFSVPSSTATAGTLYIIALVITSGTGTTACRAWDGPSAATAIYDFPFISQGSMNTTFGANQKRFWYTQNSDAPSSGTPSSNGGGFNYFLGVRAQF